jgi:hypothetical protein
MYEIASAEEQITLFKLITDKVWQSLADQKKHQDEQAAQQRRQAAMTGSGRAKRGSSRGRQVFCVRGAQRLVHGGGRRLRRTAAAVGKSV